MTTVMTRIVVDKITDLPKAHFDSLNRVGKSLILATAGRKARNYQNVRCYRGILSLTTEAHSVLRRG